MKHYNSYTMQTPSGNDTMLLGLLGGATALVIMGSLWIGIAVTAAMSFASYVGKYFGKKVIDRYEAYRAKKKHKTPDHE